MFFCKNIEKTPMNLFSNCYYVISKWVRLSEYFKDYINLTQFTQQTATLGYMDTQNYCKIKFCYYSKGLPFTQSKRNHDK